MQSLAKSTAAGNKTVQFSRAPKVEIKKMKWLTVPILRLCE